MLTAIRRGAGFGAHDAPLAAGREAGAAEAAQAGVFHRLDDASRRRARRRGMPAAARSRRRRGRRARSMKPSGCVRRGWPAFDLRFATASQRRLRHRVLAHHRGRRLLAAADAGRRDHAHVACPAAPAGAASRSCAPAISHDRPSHTRTVSAGGAASPSLHDLEVVVEGRDLVDLGLRQLISCASAARWRALRVAEVVVDLVQVFDQQVGWRDPSPSRRCTSAERPPDRRRRPFGASRLRCRLRRLGTAMGMIWRSSVHFPAVVRLLRLRSRARRASASICRGAVAELRAAPRRCARPAAASASLRSGCRTS